MNCNARLMPPYLLRIVQIIVILRELSNLLPVSRVLLSPVWPRETASFAPLLPQLFKFTLHWIAVVIKRLVFLFPLCVLLLTDFHVMLPQVMCDPIFEHFRMCFFLGELILNFFKSQFVFIFFKRFDCLCCIVFWSQDASIFFYGCLPHSFMVFPVLLPAAGPHSFALGPSSQSKKSDC